MRGIGFLVSVFMVVSSANACLAAQDQAAKPGDPPVFKTSARAVVVDVVVTDGKGAPVAGLSQSSFQVSEEGKGQTIDFFEEHKAKALPPGALPALPAMPPNVYTNVPPAPPSDSVNVLMLDMLNTPEQDFAYARKQVIAFLHDVKPGTRLAIVTLGNKLTFVQGFTTDAAALLAAVEDKRKGANGEVSQALISRSEVAELNATVAMRQASLGGQSDLGVAALQDVFAAYEDFAHRNRTLMTLEALNYLAQYLENVPGRKNLIWFASSFPVAIFPNLSERQEAQDLVVPLSQVRKTADKLTAARVAVYPVNARGMMNDSGMDADSRGMNNTPSIGAAGSMSPMGGYMADAAQRSELTAEMNQLAADTGGKAIYNTNDLNTATSRAIDDGAHYYTLVYSPTNKKMDGNYRRIAVNVTGGKYKLSYRRGYNADDLASLKAPEEQNPLRPLMLLGMPASSEILYAVRALPASPQPAANAPHAGKNAKLTGPVTRLSVDFMIRWTDVKLDPTPQGTHSGKIQVELLVYDRDGHALNWAGGTQAMNLNAETFAAIQRSGLPAHFDIDVPQNTDVYLSTGVYDWEAKKAGTLEIPLRASGSGADAQGATAPK